MTAPVSQVLSEAVHVPVRECDREAAAELRAEIQRQIGPRMGLGNIENGDFDVQLLARHRLSACVFPSLDDPFAEPMKSAWRAVSEGIAAGKDHIQIARDVLAAALAKEQGR